jgi:hypothetical protein
LEDECQGEEPEGEIKNTGQEIKNKSNAIFKLGSYLYAHKMSIHGESTSHLILLERPIGGSRLASRFELK